MSAESEKPSIDSADALGEALRIYMEHRAGGSGESDSQLLQRNPKLRELLQPLLEQDAPGGDAIRPDGVIGDYRLIEVIGRGGMGEVWEAEQISLKRRVALKLLRAHVFASTHSIERFRREALAGARLRHPCIVAVHAVGESNGVHFIAQELIESRRTLSNMFREAREQPAIPANWWREIAQLFARLADALEVAHQNGIIHRDLKPSNILIAKDGLPKIADFGLALVAGESELSRTGDLSGSPFYMSPEQAASKRVGIDSRSDVFSLGATMFEALTLQRPFEGDTVAQVLAKILFHDPRDPREIRSLCPRDLAVICMKMLEKVPTQRYPSMRAVADELERFLRNEPIRARPPGVVGRCVKWSRRHPVLAASSAIVCVSLAVVSGLLVETLRARDAAQKSAIAAAQSASREAAAARAAETSATAAEASAIEAKNSAIAERESARRAEASAIAERESARLAEAAASSARLEARTSSRVVDFLVDAFYATSPARSQGRELSAREVLDRGVNNIRSGLTDPAEAGLRSRLLDSLGLVYSRMGRRAEAEDLLLEAKRLAEQAFGPLDPHTIDVDAELALLYQGWGRRAEAIALMEEVHAKHEMNQGEGSRAALRAEANLGMMLGLAGELDRAEEHLRHSLDGLKAIGEWRAPALMALSEVLRVRGNPEESLALLREAHHMLNAELGPENPDTLLAVENMARHEVTAGRNAEGGKLFRQVAAARSCILGPSHSMTITAQGQAAYLEAGSNPSASVSELRQLQILSLEELGPNDPTTTLITKHMADLLARSGRAADARPELVAALTSMAHQTAVSPIDRSDTLALLGTVEAQLGRPELALALMEEVIGSARIGMASAPKTVDGAIVQAISLQESLGELDAALELAAERLASLDEADPKHASASATVLRLRQKIEDR